MKKSRTLLDRAKAIFTFLEFNYEFYSEQSIPKSKFQEIGISPREMENWLELIEFIQSKPQILVRREKKRTNISLIENKFMLHMKKLYMNSSMNDLDREGALLLYYKSMLNLEKAKAQDVSIENLIEENWKIDRPTIKRIAEDAYMELK